MNARTTPVPRMAADARRILLLDAATKVFGERGYAGATTDQIATAAGVSQPYVVRMFGTKEKLFIEVLHRDLDRMLAAFRAELLVESNLPLHQRLGTAYVDLLQDRGLLLSLMHGFVLGSDPVIGELARCDHLRDAAALRIGEKAVGEENRQREAEGRNHERGIA